MFAYDVPEEETYCAQFNAQDQLLKLAIKLKHHIPTGHRRHSWFKQYSNCFTGMEAVEWMLENMEARSIREAVHKGQYLFQLNWIEKVDKENKFEYSRKRFYRFTVNTPDICPISASSQSSTRHGDIPLSGSSRRRALAALIGAFVAEAASSSWNGVSNPIQYVPDLLHVDVEPAFYSISQTSSSQLTRHLSSTGYEARVILQSLAARGEVNGYALAEDTWCGYQRHSSLLSKYGRSFLKRVQGGKRFPHSGVKCRSIDVLAFIPMVVALYAGKRELFAKVQELVHVLYNGHRVIDAAMVAAYILEQIILGASVLQAMEMSIRTDRLTINQRKLVLKAFTKSELSTVEAIQKFGNKGSLPNGLCGVLQPLFGLNDYTMAIRENMVSGGRTCRRAMFIGACFGAQEGLAAIPKSWVKQTPYFAHVQSYATLLLSQDRKGQCAIFPSKRNDLYLDDCKNEYTGELTAELLHKSQLLYLDRIKKPPHAIRASYANSDTSDVASQYSYTSHTTRGSSALTDFGDMSEFYKHNTSPSGDRNVYSYQQIVRGSRIYSNETYHGIPSTRSSSCSTIGRTSKVFFQSGAQVPKTEQSNIEHLHPLYSSLLCTPTTESVDQDQMEAESVDVVFAQHFSLHGSERASLLAIM